MSISIVLLLVEDEPLIRLGMQEALESGGFTVLTAGHGAEALSLLESRHLDLSGLITDIRIGAGPTGWEVAHRARELKPEIALVYVTGDSAQDWPAEGLPNSMVIQKPFADAQLVTAISTLLTEAGTRHGL